MDEKALLRREMLARRDAIPEAERERIADALTDQLLEMPEYTAARSVLATMAIGSEWSTLEFLEEARDDGKLIVLPRLTPPPRHLELYVVKDLERHLVPGVWDIPEPDPARCERVELRDVDFAVVPALAVDPWGYRLGYGAGYFDRLLANRGQLPFCVIAISAAFMVERLPHESHDVPVDCLLHEGGVAARLRGGGK
jgi:5,10-methenyltetrahydrofolate synthetase